jgi:hypothetical protein
LKCPCGESDCSLEGVYTCEDCGVFVPEGMHFCGDCGTPLTVDNITSSWVDLENRTSTIVCDICDEIRELSIPQYNIEFGE